MAKYRCDDCNHENDTGGTCPECAKEYPDCALEMSCTICLGQAREFDGYYCSNPKLKGYSDLDCPDDDLKETDVECGDCGYWKKCPCQELKKDAE